MPYQTDQTHLKRRNRLSLNKEVIWLSNDNKRSLCLNQGFSRVGVLALLQARSEVQTRPLTVNHIIMIGSVKGKRQMWLWVPQRHRCVTPAQMETCSREQVGRAATTFSKSFWRAWRGSQRETLKKLCRMRRVCLWASTGGDGVKWLY